MESENLKIIQEVISALGGAGSAIVAQYTVWFIVSSICYSVLGAVIAITAFKWKPVEQEGYGDSYIWRVIARYVLMFIGGLFIAANLPDLFAPEAMAMHQLLRDIKIGS